MYITLPRATRVQNLNIVVVLVLQMKTIYQPLTCQEAFVYHCKKKSQWQSTENKLKSQELGPIIMVHINNFFAIPLNSNQ